jgi:glucosylceramidase
MEDPDFLGVRLVECTTDTAGSFEAIPVLGDDEGRINIRLLNPPQTKKELCFVVRELRNGGGAYGPRGGAQVTLGRCTQESAKWIYDEKRGELSSVYFADDQGNSNTVCMTTGWPFLQVGAFLTPRAESPKTVVILNEANGQANFALRDGNNVLLTASIPPRSIQTVLIE